MNCPSGIKSFYVNAIHYSKSMTIASVPAMWRDEVQAAIDEIDAAEKAALQEKMDKLEEAHQKLEEEAKEKEESEKTDTSSTEKTPTQQPSDAE
jgi:hypothetical protein